VDTWELVKALATGDIKCLRIGSLRLPN